VASAFEVYPPLIRKKSGFARQVMLYRGLLLLLVPSIVWFLIFQYYPMYGVIIAFKKYRILDGMLGSPWVGLANFQRLFRSPQFLQVLRNTLLISFYKLVFGFPMPIILALLLNEITNLRFKKTIQTISYLPHFISWVVIGGLIRAVLSPTTGVVNFLLGLLNIGPINFMVEPAFFRPMVVAANIWKNVGWGSIIYLASISGIDPQLYEAAVMDGANRWRQAIHITLPSLAPVIVILFLLRIGYIMNAGFEEILNLYNPVVYSVGDIIDTYVYRVGLIDFDYSYSTAIGLFKNVLGLSLLILTNTVTKRFSQYGVW
jgi:putative aldouronate transport system permease protein